MYYLSIDKYSSIIFGFIVLFAKVFLHFSYYQIIIMKKKLDT